MIFVGLDLHKRYVTPCAIDADGQLIAEARRVGPDLPIVSGWLGRLTGPVTVVLEPRCIGPGSSSSSPRWATSCKSHIPTR